MFLNYYPSNFYDQNATIWNNLGDVLLVGEGNLSFAKSLIMNRTFNIDNMAATIFESAKECSDDSISNAAFLRLNRAEIKFNIDATKINILFKGQIFDTIIFQFPNVGSREPIYGHNPNHILIRKFLKNAKSLLSDNGKILITTVDDNHYKGQFKFDEAAKFAGYRLPEIYPFDPKIFKGYAHINTNDDESAIEKYNKFATWVFRI